MHMVRLFASGFGITLRILGGGEHHGSATNRNKAQIHCRNTQYIAEQKRSWEKVIKNMLKS